MAVPITRLNLTPRTTTSSVPFPCDPQDQQSVAIRITSQLSLCNLETRSHRGSSPPPKPTAAQTRQTPAKRKACVSRHAIYIPANVPGPLVAECIPPSLPRNAADSSRCHTPFQTLRPTPPITDVIPNPTPTVPPLPRPSIRPYASSPSMALRPQPPPFPNLSLHAKASRPAENPPVPKHVRKTRRQCHYGYGYDPHLISGLHPEHPRPRTRRETVVPPPEHFMEESDSSNMGTPAAIYVSESDSDSTSSFDRTHDEDLQCEFPKPPTSTNGAVWGGHLEHGLGRGRGMRGESSPLFTEEETDAVKRFLRRRWGTGIDRGGERVSHAAGGRQVNEDWEGDTDFSWEAESPKHERAEGVWVMGSGLALDPLGKNDDASGGLPSLTTEGVEDTRARRGVVRGLGYDLPAGVAEHDQHGQRGVPVDAGADANHASRDLSASDATPAYSKPRGVSSSHSPYANPSQRYGVCLASALSTPATHVIRKVSSMKDKPDRTIPSEASDFRETLPLRLRPKSPSALDRLEASIKQLHAYKSSRPQESQSIPGSSGTQVPFPHDFVSLEKSGRRRPFHRSQASLPPAVVRCVSEGKPLTSSSSAPTSIGPNPLAKPFLHRSTWSPSQPPVMHHDKPIPPREQATRERGLKSFMDITPEREARLSSSGVHKERVRKLLARASNGVLGWGRSLTRKGSLAR